MDQAVDQVVDQAVDQAVGQVSKGQAAGRDMAKYVGWAELYSCGTCAGSAF